MNTEEIIDKMMNNFEHVVFECGKYDKTPSDYVGMVEELTANTLKKKFFFRGNKLWVKMKGIHYRCDLHITEKEAKLTILNYLHYGWVRNIDKIFKAI